MTKQKSPSAESTNPNASRLRDNQRRSRARKKEYVATLEAKYQECQRMGVEASIEIQNAARAVVRENLRLKELLKKVGLLDKEIDNWLVDGGLETGAVQRVQSGLGRRPCPPLDGGLGLCSRKTASRAEMLARRSSTGGMLMKPTAATPTLPRRASIMPDGSASGASTLGSRPAATQKAPSPLKSQLQLQTAIYTGNHSYPTPSTTATPTSTTSSSPYSQTAPLPLARAAVTSTTAPTYTGAGNSQHPSPSHIAASTAAAFATLTSSTTSPSMLSGAANGWNSFQSESQLPPPALSPTVLRAFVQQAQQQQVQQAQQKQQQQQRMQAGNLGPMQQLQQQQYQQYASSMRQGQQQHQQKAQHSSCHISSSIMSQFQPDGLNASIQHEHEICSASSSGNNSPLHSAQPGQFQYHQEQDQNQSQFEQHQMPQRRHSDPCCSGLVDCGDDDDSLDDINDPNADQNSPHSFDNRISMNAMGNSGMGLSGVGQIDLSGGRMSGNNEQQNTGQDNGLMGCPMDNAMLFGVLGGRMVG